MKRKVEKIQVSTMSQTLRKTGSDKDSAQVYVLRPGSCKPRFCSIIHKLIFGRRVINERRVHERQRDRTTPAAESTGTVRSFTKGSEAAAAPQEERLKISPSSLQRSTEDSPRHSHRKKRTV